MDLKAIKQVVEMMKRSEISEFEIEEKDFKLRLSRKNGDTQIIQAAAPVAAAPIAPAAPAAPATAAAPAVEQGVSVVKSPMVGTFYTAASPDSPVFAKVGGKVGADSIVCIIEAMKVMNEIQAELSGTITEVLVENGEAVEYGQPLFKVKTA
ncbi:MAG: acetyl-CoA carboxylase biotin carboxyl carrier protein [Opitutae bacterium]|nr:acetyl-CoA carboxylase biotin carboxyl carrier protein [Opitutae bacterium]MDG2345856.1 acetyl-CoA carboxylase biotin carboxyl carrier protein [Opitutae bacterium]